MSDREAFEASIRKRYPRISLERVKDEDDYCHSTVSIAWRSWQAAIASMQGEAVEITKDSKLPFAIRIGNGTIGKGCKFSTLLLRINAHNEWFAQQGFHLIPEKDAEIARLSKELEEARKDAERYRWLRDNSKVCWDLLYENVEVSFELDSESFNDLDEAIDAAISKIGGGE